MYIFLGFYAFQSVFFATIYNYHAIHSSYFISGFGARNKMIDPITFIQKKTWEGLFIKIENLSEKNILGNVYRPPRERNENYQSFINELVPIFNKLDNNKCEIVLTGDFNINLLKVNQKPILYEFFDTITSHSFYSHSTLPTTLSEKSGSLIDNLFCKLTFNLIDTSACILTSSISDHFPYLLSINI